jgi:hypothetical protein
MNPYGKEVRYSVLSTIVRMGKLIPLFFILSFVGCYVSEFWLKVPSNQLAVVVGAPLVGGFIIGMVRALLLPRPTGCVEVDFPTSPNAVEPPPRTFWGVFISFLLFAVFFLCTVDLLLSAFIYSRLSIAPSIIHGSIRLSGMFGMAAFTSLSVMMFFATKEGLKWSELRAIIRRYSNIKQALKTAKS